ncbi:MAG TPA: 5'-methylthioadenosine/S-adenosylhomocysteine nucleosidase [Geminicoccaceae bacterium]
MTTRRRRAHLPSLLPLLAALLLPAAAGAQDAPGGRLDPKPRVAVISAFAPELKVLASRTQPERTVSANGVEFTLGRLAGEDVVLFLSGVSMVNAAMTTQLALDRFDVRAIVFSGIAGGVTPELHIGDVVVPERWGQYLESAFARETGSGTYAIPPFLSKPPYANYGMMFPQPVNVRSAAQPAGEDRFWFEADPGMLQAARGLAGTLRLRRCAAQDSCLGREPLFRVGGEGVSGQAFVDNKAFREHVFATFGADVLDMESAAVAHVAHANGTPLIVFRSLSDLAGGGEAANEMGTFLQLAADNSADAVAAFLEAWSPAP